MSVDRIEKKFINIVIGKRDRRTGLKLWKKTKNKSIEKVYTDYYIAYKKMITKKIYVQSKAETYTIERYNSLLRHYLARMRRKTKCYSKCVKMLKYSIKLLIANRNNYLSIIR